MTFRALGVLLFLACSFTHADSTQLRNYKEYVDNLKRLMAEHPEMSLDDIAKLASGGEVVLQTQNSTMVAEASLHKGTRVLEFDSTTKQIQVLIADGENVQIHDSPDQKVRVSADVYSAISTDEVNDLLQKISVTKQSDGSMAIGSLVSSYACYRRTINGALSVGGSCYLRVIVQLPKGSDILVMDKKNRLNQLDRPLTKNEFIVELQGAFATDRTEKFADLLSKNSKLKFSVAEGVNILNLIFQIDRLQALGQLTNRLPNLNAQDVSDILSTQFPTDKFSAFKLLLPKVAKPELGGIRKVIDDHLTFDKDGAQQLLLDRAS